MEKWQNPDVTQQLADALAYAAAAITPLVENVEDPDPFLVTALDFANEALDRCFQVSDLVS